MPTSTAISDYELERKKPMPSLNHANVQANLIFELKRHYREQYRILSELSIELAEWSTVPDLCIFPKMELDMKNDVTHVTTPPLGVIEILSPTQSLNGLASKASQYFQHGVRSCWIVLPALSSIYVFNGPDQMRVFTAKDMLEDAALEIEFSLEEVFL